MKTIVDDAVYLGACPLLNDECRDDRRREANDLTNTCYLEDITFAVVHCYAVVKTE